jgi:hypothetical protein
MRRIRILNTHLPFVASLLAFLFVFHVPALAQSNPLGPGLQPSLLELVQDELLVETVDIQDLELPREPWQEFHVDIDLEGARHTLALYPFSVRSWDFRLLVQVEDGTLKEVANPPPPRTFEGSVLGMADSKVAASLIDGRLTATIELGREAHYIVQPLSDAVESAGRERHVIFNTRDERGGEWTCATGEKHMNPDAPDCTCPHSPNTQGATTGTGNEICEIAFDADYEFFTKNQSSVTNTVNDIESILNGMRVVYERDVGITYELTTVIVRTTSNDPYTTSNPEGLLDQFKAEWKNNLKQIARDTAHLMTGKGLQGSTIGIAWVGVICAKNSAFGLSESKFSSNYNKRVALTSHEVGHNWNAGHCTGGTCHIMCAGLNGCGGIGAPEFGPVSINTITAYRDTRACLDPEPDPLEPPFIDHFAGIFLDETKWTHINDVTVMTDSSNPPSLPYALHMDTTANGAYSEDEIRSNVILLEGKSGYELSFWYQHKGVESGEKLTLSYWADSEDWVNLAQLISNGADMGQFVKRTYALPGNAYHDQFRFRFRTEVDEQDDEWYIDNVFVGKSSTVPALADINPKAGKEAGGTTITIQGSNFTSNPAMTVNINGEPCTNVTVLNATTLTCQTPPGTNSWVGLEIASNNGGDFLFPGFRYFPVTSDPFNGSDVPTGSVNAPLATKLIVSGNPGAPYLAFLSFGGGPLSTPWGQAGLDMPVYFLFSLNLPAQGFSLIPLDLEPGSGPLDFYIHILSVNGGGATVWASGGGNPNGTGSIYYHVNN